MTPAIRAAKAAGIDYTLHEYQHDANAASYGEEAASALGVDAARVFKTLLVASNAGTLAVAIVPVSHQLNFKSVAKALGMKKVAMADPKKAQRATAYVLGGISPLGQKTKLNFVLDDSSTNYPTIYVSAGKRGLEIELSPSDLMALTEAQLAHIRN